MMTVAHNHDRASRTACSSRIAACCCSLLIGALMLPGCGGGSGDTPELGQVTGVVTLDGQPLPKANVEFAPASGRPSFGETDEDGRYSLEYLAGHAGAVVGSNTVKISTGGYGEAGPIPEKVPARYHAKSELKADVKPGSNDLNFDLRSK